MSGTADQFHYVWQSLSGDGSASAHVIDQANTDPWAKGGVMLRRTADAGSPFYELVTTPSHGLAVQYRADQGGAVVHVLSVTAAVPNYLKVGRSGSTYTAYTSTDGVSWTAITGSSVSVHMTGPVLAGVAVTSHNTAAISTVTVDQLTVTEAPVPIVTPTDTPTATPLVAATATTTPTHTSTVIPTPTVAPTSTLTPTLTSTPTPTKNPLPVSSTSKP